MIVSGLIWEHRQAFAMEVQVARAVEFKAEAGEADGLLFGPPGPSIPMAWADLARPDCLSLPAAQLQRLREFVAPTLLVMPCRAASDAPTLVAKPGAADPGTAALGRVAERGVALRNQVAGLPEIAGLPFEARVAFSADRTFVAIGDPRSGVIMSWPGGRSFYEDPTPLGQLRALVRDESRHMVIRPQPDLSQSTVDVSSIRKRAIPAPIETPRPSNSPQSGMRTLRDAGFNPSTTTGVLCLLREDDAFTMTVSNPTGRSIALAQSYVGVIVDQAGSEISRHEGSAEDMLAALEAARTPAPRR